MRFPAKNRHNWWATTIRFLIAISVLLDAVVAVLRFLTWPWRWLSVRQRTHSRPDLTAASSTRAELR